MLSTLLGLQKRSIVEGFRSGRAIWTGHFRYDYLFFFANENIRGHIIFGSHHHFDPAPYWVKFTIFAEVMLVNFLLAEIANALSSHRYAFSIFIIGRHSIARSTTHCIHPCDWILCSKNAIRETQTIWRHRMRAAFW